MQDVEQIQELLYQYAEMISKDKPELFDEIWHPTEPCSLVVGDRLFDGADAIRHDFLGKLLYAQFQQRELHPL